MTIMPPPARAKRNLGEALGGDRLVPADATETQTYVLPSGSTPLGLGLFALTRSAWPDPLTGLVIALLAIPWGREAWEDEPAEDDDDTDRSGE